MLSGTIEVLAGVLVLLVPGVAIELLLRGSPDPGAEVLARLFGAGVLALGVAGLAARNEASGPSGRALGYGFTCYNLVAVVVIVWAAAGLGLGGPLLWGAGVLHAAIGLLFVYVLVVPAGKSTNGGQRS